MSTIEFLRQYRMSGFAIIDFVASFLGILIISPIVIKFFNYFGIRMSVSNLMWLTIPISILFHILFSTYTPLTKMFLDTSGFYLVKIIIGFMIYMGFKGILF